MLKSSRLCAALALRPSGPETTAKKSKKNAKLARVLELGGGGGVYGGLLLGGSGGVMKTVQNYVHSVTMRISPVNSHEREAEHAEITHLSADLKTDS